MIYEKDIRKVRFMDELKPGATFYLKDENEFLKCEVPKPIDVVWLQHTKKYFAAGRLFLNTKNPGKPVLYNSL